MGSDRVCDVTPDRNAPELSRYDPRAAFRRLPHQEEKDGAASQHPFTSFPFAALLPFAEPSRLATFARGLFVEVLARGLFLRFLFLRQHVLDPVNVAGSVMGQDLDRHGRSARDSEKPPAHAHAGPGCPSERSCGKDRRRPVGRRLRRAGAEICKRNARPLLRRGGAVVGRRRESDGRPPLCHQE